MIKSSDKVAMENANSPGRPVRVDADKFNAMKRAILVVLPKSPPGLTGAELKARLLPLLPQELFPGVPRLVGGSRASSSILKQKV